MSELKQSGVVLAGEVALVWRALNGRRYFSKGAAFRASARHMMKRKCECEAAESDEYGRLTFRGWACRYHDDSNHGERTLDRLTRWLKRRARNETRSTGCSVPNPLGPQSNEDNVEALNTSAERVKKSGEFERIAQPLPSGSAVPNPDTAEQTGRQK